MAGVSFTIWVPTEEHEKSLKVHLSNKVQIPRKTLDPEDSANSWDESSSITSHENFPEPNASEAGSETDQSSMEKKLSDLFEALKLTHVHWSSNTNETFKKVTFCLASGQPSEDMLSLLTERGIGHKLNSVVSIIPCSIYYHGNEANLSPQQENIEALKEQEDITAWEKFLESARPQLFLPQVIRNVKANASFTFDFVVFLIISTLLAATGLLEQSAYVLVASMILSPMMGPATAVIVGTVIRDRGLQRLGIANGLLGLLLCIIIGFLFGLAVSFAGNLIGNDDWPTQEMISKGKVASLWAEMIIALLSGAAIAIAILNEHTSSAIGTAISVALLPPAVNAGLLWSMAAFHYTYHNNLAFFINYNPQWSPKPFVELAILGGISLCVTMINIVCVFISGIVIMKLKEILPKSVKGSKKWNLNLAEASNYERFDRNEDVCTPNQTPQYPEFKNLRHLSLLSTNQYTWSPSSTYSRPPLRSVFPSTNANYIKSGCFPRRAAGSFQHFMSSASLCSPPTKIGSPKHFLKTVLESEKLKKSPKPGRFSVVPAT